MTPKKNLKQCYAFISFLIIFSLICSCSKDEDLLSQYVINDSSQNFNEGIVVDDIFISLNGSSNNFNVLFNDNFDNVNNVKIINVSNPSNGTVVINNDNTLSYVAPQVSENITDSFTYTAEENNENGQTTSGTGNVTVEVTSDNASKTLSNYLYTDDAKSVLKERFQNGYIAGSGFNNDIAQVMTSVNEFKSNPSQYRPVFGDINGEIERRGHNIHVTAVYAYTMDDVELANIVAKELLESIKANSLHTTYWNTSNAIRWDSTNDQLWVQCSKAKKMKDSYYFIKNLQNVLSEENKSEIDAWFKRFADLAFVGVSNRIDSYFGQGWDANNFTDKYYTGNIFIGEEPNPIQDAQGNDLFLMALPQDVYNNRHWDILGYVHSWAVSNNDLEKEIYCRNFFKVFLKYGVFPDGTIWEVKRNNSTVPTVGISYGWITAGTAVQMAHLDAMANHFPNDKLYDYKTTDGVVKGSKKISDTDYAGTSTTDGVTEKSLLTLIKGQAKYLRSESNGGWNDLRYYRTIPLNSKGLEQPSAIPAMANLYYKDQELEDLYRYNTNVGYPPKQSISGGYMAGVWDKDSGSWGNILFGSMWYGQENNFFSN